MFPIIVANPEFWDGTYDLVLNLSKHTVIFALKCILAAADTQAFTHFSSEIIRNIFILTRQTFDDNDGVLYISHLMGNLSPQAIQLLEASINIVTMSAREFDWEYLDLWHFAHLPITYFTPLGMPIVSMFEHNSLLTQILTFNNFTDIGIPTPIRYTYPKDIVISYLLWRRYCILDQPIVNVHNLQIVDHALNTDFN